MVDLNKALWQKCVDFHGHACPGLAIGFQVSQLAQDDLEIDFSADEEIVCITENDACGVDAVQYITGCTFGEGNLIYRAAGKQVFSFFVRESNRQARYVLQRSEDWPEDREEGIKWLLAQKPAQLFTKKEPHYELPQKARIFDTVICKKCGEGTAEFAIRLEEGQKVCRDCYDDYFRGQKNY